MLTGGEIATDGDLAQGQLLQADALHQREADDMRWRRRKYSAP